MIISIDMLFFGSNIKCYVRITKSQKLGIKKNKCYDKNYFTVTTRGGRQKVPSCTLMRVMTEGTTATALLWNPEPEIVTFHFTCKCPTYLCVDVRESKLAIY